MGKILTHFFIKIISLALILHLSGCGGGARKNMSKNILSYQKLCGEDQGHFQYKGHYKIGQKYKINGKTYYPKEVTRYKKHGIASWYGERYGFHGNKTANGDLYNKEMLTAAHNTLQLPCLVKVTNLANNKSLIVMINDRGPFAQNRIIDLSERAAEILDFKKQGFTEVKIEYLHNESKKLLNILKMQQKEHYIPKSPLSNKKCTVNCHLKIFNYKHNIQVD